MTSLHFDDNSHNITQGFMYRRDEQQKRETKIIIILIKRSRKNEEKGNY